jgi:hypothetical protein
LGNSLLGNIVKPSQHGSMNNGSHCHSEGDGGEADGVGSGHFILQI